jgi:ADP-ribose pyrophosphatase YjhB (NUDIX family)
VKNKAKNMQIKSKFKNRSGKEIEYIYYEKLDPMEGLDGKILQAVHGFCFCGDKLVLVKHKNHGWQPPGGHIENGETIESTVIREVKEESNMKVLHQELIGFIDVYEGDRIIRQTRSFCIVEPYGDFTVDTDIEGDVTEIKLISPTDYKQYFDWGEIGDRIMKRALEMKEKLNKN